MRRLKRWSMISHLSLSLSFHLFFSSLSLIISTNHSIKYLINHHESKWWWFVSQLTISWWTISWLTISFTITKRRRRSWSSKFKNQSTWTRYIIKVERKKKRDGRYDGRWKFLIFFFSTFSSHFFFSLIMIVCQFLNHQISQLRWIMRWW